MRVGYSDLTAYWECPRKLGFIKIGYHPAVYSEAITAGLLAHTGVFAALRGGDANKAMAQQAKSIKATSEEDVSKMVNDAYLRATGLAERYLHQYAKDYEVLEVEPELTSGNVLVHPDLIVKYHGELAIVDIKTSKSPDYRWYDISGQVDLYAVVAEKEYGEVAWCIYDVISDEGIFRHQRPPREEQEEKMRWSCEVLAKHTIESLLIRYQPKFDCPNRCQYFEACWLLTTDSLEAATRWLEENMVKEADNDPRP